MTAIPVEHSHVVTKPDGPDELANRPRSKALRWAARFACVAPLLFLLGLWNPFHSVVVERMLYQPAILVLVLGGCATVALACAADKDSWSRVIAEVAGPVITVIAALGTFLVATEANDMTWFRYPTASATSGELTAELRSRELLKTLALTIRSDRGLLSQQRILLDGLATGRTANMRFVADDHLQIALTTGEEIHLLLDDRWLAVRDLWCVRADGTVHRPGPTSSATCPSPK